MELFTDEVIRGLLAQSLATATFDGTRWTDPAGGGGSHAGEFIDWLTFKDLAQSVVIDVEQIRQHPLVPTSIPIHGYLYEVTSGRLIEVPQATAWAAFRHRARGAARDRLNRCVASRDRLIAGSRVADRARPCGRPRQ